MDRITFVSGNKAKIERLKQYVDLPLDFYEADLPEIQSLDLAEIIASKAKAAYELVQKPVLVEDIGLSFTALGTLPGPLIKWFLQALDTDGLCRLLDQYGDRSATSQAMLGLYDGTNLQTFSAETPGTIALTPRGTNNFGWDPIFIPQGQKKTWAEMTFDEQKQTSTRKVALEKLATYLAEHK